MNKTKFLFIGLLSLALICGMLIIGCGGDTETWTANPPVLTGVTIAGATPTRGTPNTKPAEVVAGSVTLKSKKIEEGVPVLTVDNPTIATRPSTVAVQFAVTPNSTPPATYNAAKPTSLSDGEYLWIKATANGASNYYAIKIKVEYSPVEVFAIKSHPASRVFTLTDWATAAPLTVVMEEASEGYEYLWYSNNSFSNEGGMAVSSGGTTASYKPEITANGEYYYYVTVTFSYTIAGNTTTKTVTSNPAWISIAATVAQAPTEFSIGDTRVNYVRGVGGTGSFMFRTGSNADASPDADVNYIDLLMGTLGANVLRIMVQDDYLNYIENTVQSGNVAQFPHDARKNFFPVIRRVNEAGGYVFANPWTGPTYLMNLDKTIANPGYWLKSRDDGGNTQAPSEAGGYLRQTAAAYVDYADHFRNFLTWLNMNDAPIFALGILNEPDNGGGANYEGMGMTGNVTRDWFRVVGHFTTQKADRNAASATSRGALIDDVIPGYGGGGPTHHVLTMTPDPMGSSNFNRIDPAIDDSTPNGANNVIELVGIHLYSGAARYTKVAGAAGTAWADRPQPGSYVGPYEDASLTMSPQMYAPGSMPGNIKREVWQTEHDFNYSGASVIAANDVSKHWNSAFAAMNDIDWCLRVVGKSVFDWWFSSSYSGFVTSYHNVHGGPRDGSNPNPANTWGPYQITPRGRAFAHYGRYVNETWLLDISRTRGTINFNTTSTSFDAGSTDPKISAFEDVNGKFISIVMFTPTTSTNNGAIGPGFGAGGTSGNSDPTRGSTNVGKIAVVLPAGFVASGATALRSYGQGNSTGAAYDTVPSGSPRYWINEPVFLSTTSENKSVVEVTLPGGNIISIKVMGEWTGAQAGSRHFEPRPRPYERYQSGQMSGPIMVEGMNPAPDR